MGDRGVILKTTDLNLGDGEGEPPPPPPQASRVVWSKQDLKSAATTKNLRGVCYYDDNFVMVVGDDGCILR